MTMLGKVIVFIVQYVSLLILHTVAVSAHGLAELDRLFEDEPIPNELVELTKELEITEGTRSLRGGVHVKQHEILEQYMRARTERKCTESLANISRLDLEIVELQERGHHEQEEARREAREDTAAFIKESCNSPPFTR